MNAHKKFAAPGVNYRKRYVLGDIQSTEEQESMRDDVDIIGESSNSCNQMLLMYLPPDTIVYHHGKIVMSNNEKSGGLQLGIDLQDAAEWLMQYIENIGNPVVLNNTTSQTHYCVLKKPYGRDGKILVLYEELYETSFYINMARLLTINCSGYEYWLCRHPVVSYLKNINQNKKPNIPLCLTLQSLRNGCIIEKYLGSKEKMYLANAKVLAMSTTTLVVTDPNTKELCVMGPGFVFLEPETQFRFSIRNTIPFLIMLLMLIRWFM